MASSGRPSALKYLVVTIVLLAAGAAAYWAFGRGAGGGAGAEERTGVRYEGAANAEQRARLSRAASDLARLSGKLRDREREARAAVEARRNAAAPPVGLTTDEEAALKEVAGRLYDRGAIAEALSSSDPKAGGEYAQEIERAYREAVTPEGLVLDGRRVASTPALEEALRDVDVLRSYATTLMHAHVPRDPERQRQMIRRVNESFGARLNTLRGKYPFLDVEPHDPR